MAQRVEVFFVDDIDETPADEKVKFALDGTSYEIDLSAANAGKLRDALAPYVAAGRPTNVERPKARASKAVSGPTASQVRAWAVANGHEMSERGRVPEKIRQAYDLAHA